MRDGSSSRRGLSARDAEGVPKEMLKEVAQQKDE